ncbi:hypothetical protein ACHAPV_009372 [Trichoderma viride]
MLVLGVLLGRKIPPTRVWHFLDAVRFLTRQSDAARAARLGMYGLGSGDGSGLDQEPDCWWRWQKRSEAKDDAHSGGLVSWLGGLLGIPARIGRQDSQAGIAARRWE